MSDLLPFVIAGMVAGSLYGLAATGLVLTYKTSGIFNFAHGGVGAAAAYAFYDLRDRADLPAPVAFVLAIGVLTPILGLALAWMAGRLQRATAVRRIVATIGVLLVVQGVIQIRYGILQIPFATSLPTGTISVAGTIVGYDQLVSIAITLVCLAGLATFFRYTLVGLQMRALVDNTELLDLSGGAPSRVRAFSWIIGSAFAGLSGVLFAPTVGLDALLLTLLVVQAFGAAAIGRFHHLGVTFLGALLIGVVQYLLRAPTVIDNLPFLESLPGLDQSVSFLALFAVLVLTRRGAYSERPAERVQRPRSNLRPQVRVALLALVAAGVIALPHMLASKELVLIQAAVFVTVFASLYLLVEVSGQVSLCHVTFVAIGASSFAHFTTGAGLPWLVGVALAGVVVLPIGALIAIPAIRLSGVYLALATLGLGVVVQQMIYTRGVMFGSLGQRTGARPDVFGLAGDTGYFYLCAAVAAAAIGLVVVIRSTRLGRLLNALADAPVALETHGSSTTVTRVLVFCVSASLAAVAGALLVGVVGSASVTGVSSVALVPFNSLLWLAALALAGRNSVVAPVVAAGALVVLPSYLNGADVDRWLTVGFGATALLVTLFGEPLLRWIADQQVPAARRRAASPIRSRHAMARLEAGRG